MMISVLASHKQGATESGVEIQNVSAYSTRVKLSSEAPKNVFEPPFKTFQLVTEYSIPAHTGR